MSNASACPGCAAAPLAQKTALAAQPANIILSVPTIHCAACIGTIERGLNTLPDVTSARVNLSLKRVSITAPKVDAGAMVAKLAALGFDAHPLDADALGISDDKTGRDLLLRLSIAGFAMMNVMLLSVAVWSGAAGATRDLFHLISAAISVPTIVYAAQPFFRSAWSAFRAKALNMDVPISLAIILATGLSLFETLEGGAHAYFDAALSLTFFLLIGRYLDHSTRAAAKSAAKELAALETATATRIVAGQKITTKVADLQINDRILISTGARVPVDGTLLDAKATTDRAFLTGETDAITLHQSDVVQSGEINLADPFTIVATAVGEDTTLRRMAAMVELAENSRNSYTALADRASRIYVPVVHALAAFAFVMWLMISGDLRYATNIAVAVLIITCPCALGLAVPAVSVAATSRLYRAGLLVKSDTALERLAKIDTVVFDKTGTLTERRLIVPGHMPEAHQQVLRAIAEASQHPLCRGLAETMTRVVPAQLSDISESTGEGVSAIWGDANVHLGRGRDGGATVFGIGDTVYEMKSEEQMLPGAEAAVSALKVQGLDVCMVTGDSADNADRIAGALGIANVHSGLRPEEKIAMVEALQAKGASVLMVGDGLNDTAALAAADASIAPSSALDASRNAADINIVSGDLTQITTALKISRAARSRMLENFAAAAIYNAIAVPIAVAGFATPLAAAIAMSASSITVVLNSQRGLRA